ncbi:hypothetical protein Dsin_011775 [Dipteronia sinensis]|uniref:RNase H type-1 domain-containing protein n=1 Tax=Dipteronia sinensis TaxID=43782 RepID=A0AAE0AHF3_9ROSI|nr:hypothetical protein Dsin_011775 [Dipteronia sinensis]
MFFMLNWQSSVKLRLSSIWEVLPAGVFKINTDAALNFRNNISGIGVAIRDCNGHVMASLCQHIGTAYQPQIAETLAILRCLKLAVETGLVPAVVESDALSVVNAITSKMVPNTEVGMVIHDILCILRNSNFISVKLLPRLANKVSHSLARLALGYVGEFV